MSASTKWYVTVVKTYEEIIEVFGITEEDAREEANLQHGVEHVVDVKHWSEVESE